MLWAHNLFALEIFYCQDPSRFTCNNSAAGAKEMETISSARLTLSALSIMCVGVCKASLNFILRKTSNST
jgi:hypothetical protein